MATTAQEWQQVLDQANAQKQAAVSALETAAQAAFQAKSNANAAKIAVDNEVAANGGKLPLGSTTYSAWQTAVAAETAAVNAENQAQAAVNSVNATINEATQQLANANAAPADATNPVPQPASAAPGDPNQSVVPAPTTTEQVQNPAPSQTTNPDVNNAAIGLGVDTTVISSSAAANVGPEDPAEAERLAAEQRLAEQETPEYNAPPEPDQNEYAAETNRLAAQNQAAADAAENANETARLAARGVSAAKSATQSTATNQDAVSFQKAKDWRVRLSLAPSAKYLYNATDPGILKPLAATNGVIFPYTPSINVVYSAAYDASELVHSNYKIYNYKNSSVDTVNITCDFTAQDTTEANYLLAVIHFFRSVTKMFYGRDENPRNGVPPPLCYLSGLGAFQFDNHPLAVSNFTYTLPTDVDYIRVGSTTTEPGNSKAGTVSPTNTNTASLARILSSNLGAKTPNFQRQAATINSNATYVPTKMQIAITCIPIVTRNDISNTFSLKEYATGALLQGSKRNGGGIW